MSFVPTYGLQAERCNNETYFDYFIRLAEHKDEYKLRWEDIAKLLNRQNGNDYGESAYRKFYTAFQAGRNYEADKNGYRVADRILCISDLHYPFHLPVSTFKQYRNVDTLILNGDLLDMQSISKFQRSYRISPLEEMIGCRQHLIELIEFISPKRVIINKGNHELRFGNYLAKHLDNEMQELMPETALDLMINDGFYHYDKRTHAKVWYEPLTKVFDGRIDVSYTGEWWCKYGKTIFAHPLAYSSGMLKTTEKAANYFYRVTSDFDTVVLAHTHKLGMYVQGDVTLYEQGACCDTGKLCYADGGLTLPQQQGFLYLCQDTEGALVFDQTKLVSC